jgi:hypothetical protein
VFVSDLRHFLDMPEDAPGPARAMAAQLFDLVRAATGEDPGTPWVSAIVCRRRPGNRPCRGHTVVFRPDGPGSIEWRCERCGDDGVISGWEDTAFDLRSPSPAASGAGRASSLAVSDEVAAALRDLQLLDSDHERLVYRMTGSASGAVMTTTADDLDELLGFVAAEANHEVDRRRRKRLDDAFAALHAALSTIPNDVDEEEEPLAVTGQPREVEGRWRIVEMELWDQDALDLVEPAYIDFAPDGTGQFGFIALRGWTDWRVENNGRVEFSWEGVDEGDQVNGRGWALQDGNGALTGRIYIHLGDDSAFRAIRPPRLLPP